jgi:hypothetical protein
VFHPSPRLLVENVGLAIRTVTPRDARVEDGQPHTRCQFPASSLASVLLMIP